MKNILHILCLLLLASCGGDDDLNPQMTSCDINPPEWLIGDWACESCFIDHWFITDSEIEYKNNNSYTYPCEFYAQVGYTITETITDEVYEIKAVKESSTGREEKYITFEKLSENKIKYCTDPTPCTEYQVYCRVGFECSEGNTNTLDSCTSFDPIYVTDLCGFYEEPNVVIEDKYNDKCLNIFGSITDISDKDEEVRIWLSAYPTEILCPADVTESAIRCTFEKATTSDSILTIINKYNEGDFVSIKGLFDSEVENTFFQDIFLLQSNYIANEPLSYENHCGISGKKWKCYNNCYRDFYWFIPSEDGLMLYVSSTQADKENNGTLSTWIFNYEIGSNCDELRLTDTNDGSVEVYQITSLTRTELILINEDGEETKLVKVI